MGGSGADINHPRVAHARTCKSRLAPFVALVDVWEDVAWFAEQQLDLQPQIHKNRSHGQRYGRSHQPPARCVRSILPCADRRKHRMGRRTTPALDRCGVSAVHSCRTCASAAAISAHTVSLLLQIPMVRICTAKRRNETEPRGGLRSHVTRVALVARDARTPSFEFSWTMMNWNGWT